jgi:hypothetical protein
LGHRAEVGGVRGDRLERLAAAAVDGDVRPEALLLEAPLPLRDGGEDGRELRPGRAAEPDHFLRLHGPREQRDHRAERCRHGSRAARDAMVGTWPG